MKLLDAKHVEDELFAAGSGINILLKRSQPNFALFQPRMIRHYQSHKNQLFLPYHPCFPCLRMLNTVEACLFPAFPIFES